MQLDESTITDSNDLLMTYVRFFDKKSELQEEMPFVQNLISDMRGISIFTTAKLFFEKNQICMCYCWSAVNGRPIPQFSGLSKKKFIFCIHCAIYRQHLAAKRLNRSFHTSLNLISQKQMHKISPVMKMMNNLPGSQKKHV